MGPKRSMLKEPIVLFCPVIAAVTQQWSRHIILKGPDSLVARELGYKPHAGPRSIANLSVSPQQKKANSQWIIGSQGAYRSVCGPHVNRSFFVGDEVGTENNNVGINLAFHGRHRYRQQFFWN